jgi:hypothetical protein
MLPMCRHLVCSLGNGVLVGIMYWSALTDLSSMIRLTLVLRDLGSGWRMRFHVFGRRRFTQSRILLAISDILVLYELFGISSDVIHEFSTERERGLP